MPNIPEHIILKMNFNKIIAIKVKQTKYAIFSYKYL